MDPIESWVDRDELRRMADSLLSSPQAPALEPADATYGDEFVGYLGEEPPGDPEHPAVAEALSEPAQVPAHSMMEQNARQALATARDIAYRGGLLESTATEPEVRPPDPDPDPVPDSAPAATSSEVPPTTPATAELTQVSPLPPTGAAPVSTPFMTRLQAYGTWLREGVLAKAFFVTDREGGVLIDEVQSPKLQQVARTLAQASRTANRQAGAAAIGNLHIKIAPDNILEVVPVMTRYGPLILGIIVQQPLTVRNIETVARGLQQVIDGNPGSHSP